MLYSYLVARNSFGYLFTTASNLPTKKYLPGTGGAVRYSQRMRPSNQQPRKVLPPVVAARRGGEGGEGGEGGGGGGGGGGEGGGKSRLVRTEVSHAAPLLRCPSLVCAPAMHQRCPLFGLQQQQQLVPISWPWATRSRRPSWERY